MMVHDFFERINIVAGNALWGEDNHSRKSSSMLKSVPENWRWLSRKWNLNLTSRKFPIFGEQWVIVERDKWMLELEFLLLIKNKLPNCRRQFWISSSLQSIYGHIVKTTSCQLSLSVSFVQFCPRKQFFFDKCFNQTENKNRNLNDFSFDHRVLEKRKSWEIKLFFDYLNLALNVVDVDDLYHRTYEGLASSLTWLHHCIIHCHDTYLWMDTLVQQSDTITTI